MSNRVYGRNAFESALDGAIGSADTSITLDSTTGLTAPGFLVIEPESPSSREYIKFTGISTNTLTGVTRGADGSAAGGQSHDSGSLVRMVFVHQYLDTIFTDIEALETADTDHAALGDVHHNEDHASRHEQGGADPLTMAAVLDLVYPVGSIYLSVTATNPGSIFGGTWARIGEGRTLVGLDSGDTDFDTLEEVGGSKTQATHTHSGPSHTHTGPSHSHSGPSHAHSNPNVNSNGSHAHSQGNTGSGGSHSHAAGSLVARVSLFENVLDIDRVDTGNFGSSGNASADLQQTTEQVGTHGAVVVGSTASDGSHAHTNPNVNSNGSHAHSQGNTGLAGTGQTGSAGTGNTGASGTGSTGAGGGESIVQPYLVVNMWKRTA